MKQKLLWLGAGGILFCGIVCLANTLCGHSEPRTISVTGECLTTAPKDRTAITLRVTTLDKSAATSMKLATERVAEITNFLKTQDVKIQTTEFNSYERSEWNHQLEKNENLGIETTIAIEVSADNMETIEKILTHFADGADNPAANPLMVGAATANARSVSDKTNVFVGNLHMYTSNEAMQPVLENCLAVATDNARSRANALAAGDGRRAGQMLAISYGGAPNMQPRMSNFLRGAKMVATEDTLAAVATGSLMSKDTEVSVTVNAIFEIK